MKQSFAGLAAVYESVLVFVTGNCLVQRINPTNPEYRLHCIIRVACIVDTVVQNICRLNFAVIVPIVNRELALLKKTSINAANLLVQLESKPNWQVLAVTFQVNFSIFRWQAQLANFYDA